MYNKLMTALMPMSMTLASLPAAAQTLTERSDYWHRGWDWGWGHMIFGSVMMIAFWGGIILLVVFAARWLGAGPADRTPSPPKKSTLDILNERSAQARLISRNTRNGKASCRAEYARRSAL